MDGLMYYHHGMLGLRVRTGIASEWDKRIVREVQEHYAFPKLDYSKQVTILDVGAHIGAFSLYVASLNPDAEIVAVEANKESSEIAKLNLAKLATVYHARLGYTAGDFILQYPVECPGSGAIVERGREVKGENVAYQEVPKKALTLEAIMKKHGWGRINVLKLDCEWGEYDIVKNATLEVIVSCDHIVGEYHGGYDKWQLEAWPVLSDHFEVMHMVQAADWGQFWLRRWGKA